jgi:hypothetical protein
VYAGVTVESAAKANSCTAAEITQALILPEARLIEPASDWMPSTFSPPSSAKHPTSSPGSYPSASR